MFVEDRTEVHLVLASSQDPLVRAVWVPVERHFQGVECLLRVFYKTVKYPLGLLVTYRAMRDALDWLESAEISVRVVDMRLPNPFVALVAYQDRHALEDMVMRARRYLVAAY